MLVFTRRQEKNFLSRIKIPIISENGQISPNQGIFAISVHKRTCLQKYPRREVKYGRFLE